MTDQPKLIKQVNTWMHYIGRQYTPQQFIREAEKFGITRRIPAQTARGMNYGDRVILLRYGRQGCVFAFAEMVITGIVLDGKVAQQVGEKLKAEGRAIYTQGGGMVQRQCGSYMCMGTWNVDADLPEIVDMAIKVAETDNIDVFCMIGGQLSKVYAEPALLSPAPPFTRGFIKSDSQATFEFEGKPIEREKKIVEIGMYAKRQSAPRRKSKSSTSLALASAPMM